VSEGEIDRFDLVADHYGVSVSAMIRMLVRERHEALAVIPDALGREHEDPLSAFADGSNDGPQSRRPSDPKHK
jgi:hypothetical protein